MRVVGHVRRSRRPATSSSSRHPKSSDGLVGAEVSARGWGRAYCSSVCRARFDDVLLTTGVRLGFFRGWAALLGLGHRRVWIAGSRLGLRSGSLLGLREDRHAMARTIEIISRRFILAPERCCYSTTRQVPRLFPAILRPAELRLFQVPLALAL
jgi:hypothetical protein